MQNDLFVKPAFVGCVLPMPHDQMKPLPADGAWVPSNLFWQARIHDGSVLVVSPPIDAAPAAAPDPTSAAPSKAAPVPSPKITLPTNGG